MNLRISVLCEYLTRVERGEVPFDEALLRTIDGLVRQLPLVVAALESGRLSGTTALRVVVLAVVDARHFMNLRTSMIIQCY